MRSEPVELKLEMSRIAVKSENSQNNETLLWATSALEILDDEQETDYLNSMYVRTRGLETMAEKKEFRNSLPQLSPLARREQLRKS